AGVEVHAAGAGGLDPAAEGQRVVAAGGGDDDGAGREGADGAGVGAAVALVHGDDQVAGTDVGAGEGEVAAGEDRQVGGAGAGDGGEGHLGAVAAGVGAADDVLGVRPAG